MYRTIEKEGSAEIEVKKSRFLGEVRRVYSLHEAEDFIMEMRKAHPKARHHCSALVIGEDGLMQQYDDDKEPSGTAGVPMLECLKNQELTNVVAVVIRYFGGTLLGTGGLVRAYTKALQGALEQAGIVEMTEYTRKRLCFDYTALGALEYFFKEHQWIIGDAQYGEKVEFILEVPKRDEEEFLRGWNEITSGGGLLLEEEDILVGEREGKRVEEGI